MREALMPYASALAEVAGTSFLPFAGRASDSSVSYGGPQLPLFGLLAVSTCRTSEEPGSVLHVGLLVVAFL